MSPFWVYLFTRLDDLRSAVDIAAGCSMSFLFGVGMFYIHAKSVDFWKKSAPTPEFLMKSSLCAKAAKILLVAFVASFLLRVLVPSQKDAAVIYLLPKIVNNEKIRDIPGKAVDLLNLKLEQWIAENMDIDKR